MAEDEEAPEDRASILQRVKSTPYALDHVPAKWKNDKEVVLEVVKHFGGSLVYAHEELRADKEVVLEAVKNQAPALAYASEDLRADREVVFEALQQDGYTLRFASKALRADKDIVLVAVKQGGGALEYASQALQQDKEVVVEAINQFGGALEWAGEAFQADKELVLKAVAQNGFALRYASEDLRGDKEIVLKAIQNKVYALISATSELRADRDILLQAARNGCYQSAVSVWFAEAGFENEDHFWKAVHSVLAGPGEENAPVVCVEPSMGVGSDSGGDEDEGLPAGSCRCQISLLSGASFSCVVEGASRHDAKVEDKSRPSPTVADLACCIVEELPNHTEIQHAKRVFITMTNPTTASEEAPNSISLSPWDWDRSLADFLGEGPGPS